MDHLPAAGRASGLRMGGLTPALLSATASFAAGLTLEAAASVAAAACRRLSNPFSAFILQNQELVATTVPDILDNGAKPSCTFC